ncbi:hypothetical protein [Parasitella parasitica]|uniref:Arrestin C-terminal-like domain-containing protein n=1 Tax=Parasitella parasitica TaxID=35722 RepID=A0A0B7NMU4_9FUNG|nr:hypothetical protein [Parasitella parasitica]
MDLTVFQQQRPHQQTQQQQQQQSFVIDSGDDDKAAKKRIDSAIAMKSNNQLLYISLEYPLDHIYLPGEQITGTINISQFLLSSTSKQSTARIDIHLACSFRVCEPSSNTKKQSVFKVMANPIWISLSDTNKAPFSLTIPSHLPAYNTDDKSINGRIEYKLKAVYEITDLPLSLYPKTSTPILISAQIFTADPDYTTPMQNQKEIMITIPRDVVLKKSMTMLRKGDTGLVSSRLCIPHSCFLPGESIPFTLYVQHIAPIRQAQGIHIRLERITTITTSAEEKRSVTTMRTLTLPLLCGADDHTTAINSSQQLKIPGSTSPTIKTNKLIPFSIEYRIKALVNMDMHHFMDDIPQRKRDRAYNMMSKMIMAAAASTDQQGEGPAFLYNTTVELDLPIQVGTTHAPVITAAPKHHSLPYPLHTAPSSLPSLTSPLITSPDQYDDDHSESSAQHHVRIHRFDSDPLYSRSSLSTTTEYLALPSPNEVDMSQRPPSAPPLADLVDPPPCYLPS